MKKKILLAVLVMMVETGVFGQGMPVIDITNLIQSIENAYTMYETLMATYNQLQTTYKQLEQQVKNFEGMDFSQLDWKDPLGSWRTIMSYANRQMNYATNIEKLVKAKNLKVGNQSFSLEEIFKSNPVDTGKKLYDGTVNFVAVDPFERQLTTEEKAIFHQKYGMSFGNYMRYATIGQALKNKAAEIHGYMEVMKENTEEDAARLDKILEDTKDEESEIKVGQAGNVISHAQVQELKIQTEQLNNIAVILSSQSALEQEEREMKADQVSKTELNGNPEGLIKMLGESEKNDKFRGGAQRGR
jgi:conjugal transfer/entry exclusion protein